MCLTIDNKYKKPKSSRIRWKVVFLWNNNEVLSYYLRCKYKQIGNKAMLNHVDSEQGFHVYITKKDAFYGSYLCCNVLVAKVKVSGFLKGGAFQDTPCETWKRMDFLELYNKDGFALSKEETKKLFKAK